MSSNFVIKGKIIEDKYYLYEDGKKVKIRKSDRNYGKSETCLQCGELSLEILEAFCTPQCRRKYNERIKGYRKTYQTNFETALILLQTKTLELRIRRITNPREYIRQGSLDRLPYTRKPSGNVE